ncbi:MAG TPA: TetR/AcrR family transcriptional regulator [Methanocella sp.]|jgi:AcrR family transcriptional regulator
MGRRSKDPEIRKKEFVAAALELFQTKGFEQTSVTDLTNKVGVSHGAFFYYYKSKEDILESVIEEILTMDYQLVKGLVDNGDMNAKEKLKVILNTSVNSMKAQPENCLAEYVHSRVNPGFHRDFEKRSREMLVPLITEIVEQGVREGYCEVKYPRETIEYLTYIFQSIDVSLVALQSNEEYYRKIRALELIVAKSLGIKDADIGLID